MSHSDTDTAVALRGSRTGTPAASCRLSVSLLAALGVLGISSGAAWATEPPWSRPPTWLSNPQQGVPDSPEVRALGVSASTTSSTSATPSNPATYDSTNNGLIVGAASYSLPAPTIDVSAANAAPDQTSPTLPSFATSPVPTPSPMTSSPYAVTQAPAVGSGFGAQGMASLPTSANPSAPVEKPLWELGVVTGVAYMPDYPAASQSSVHVLPLPMIRYRGNFLRSDEKGLLRGRFIHTRDMEFDISVNGSFPANSDDNDARAGMPDLDWIGEIGPRFQWTLARAAKWAKVDMEVPLRAAFSTDFHSNVTYRGLVFAPEIAYQHGNFLDSHVAVKLGLGATVASEALNDYFYQVGSAYATADRPAYDADGGYMGSKLQLSLSTELTPWVGLMGLGRVDFHQGAANEDSPLFKDDTTFTVGMALSLTLAKSKATVRETP